MNDTLASGISRPRPQLALGALLLLGGLLLGAAAKAPTLELSCDKGKTAEACLDRKVTLKAQMAGHGEASEDAVMQHPIMTSPIETEYQDYTVVSANLGQVVVISKTEIKCAKAELKGTLSLYSMQCGEGESGKCSYSNYVLRADSVKCTPDTKPAAKPVTKPVTKPAPKPTAKPTAKPATK